MGKTMKDKATLLTHNQLQALASPMRSDAFQRFRAWRKASVSDISDEMECSPESLAYHVRTLVKVGLLVPVETRPTKRRSEVVYQASALNYRLPTQAEDKVGHQLSHKVVTTGLRQTARNFQRVSSAIARGEPGFADKLHVIRMQVRLKSEDATKFRNLIDEAVRFAKGAESPAEEDADVLYWMSLVAPRCPKQ